MALVLRRSRTATIPLPAGWSPRQQLVAQGTLPPPAPSAAMRAESRTATQRLPVVSRTSTRDLPAFGGDEGPAVNS